MFGVGTGELILILVIAMLVVGPERMVSFAKQMGEWIAKFRAQTDSVTSEFKEALSLDPMVKDVVSEVHDIAATVGQTAAEARAGSEMVGGSTPSETVTAAPGGADVGRVFAEGETASRSWQEREPAPPAQDDNATVVIHLAGDDPRDAEHAEPTLLDEPVVVWEEETADSDNDSDHKEG